MAKGNHKEADKHFQLLDLFQEEDMELLTVLKRPLDEAASMLQKAIRRGEEETAVYIAKEIAESGYVDYLFRRLLVTASEDIGPVEPDITARIISIYEGMKFVTSKGKKKYDGNMVANIVLIMCRCKKTREAADLDTLIGMKIRSIIHSGNYSDVLPTPDWALDGHTARGRSKRRGEEFFQRVGRIIQPDCTTPKGELWRQKVMEFLAGESDEQESDDGDDYADE